MERILVATDFSERSDRAIRRASLLARQYGAAMTLAHVIDDDLPPSLREVQEREAGLLLREAVQSLRDLDQLQCGSHVVVDQVFRGIHAVARKTDAELIVIGPHRRRAFKDAFVGTTAERLIRSSSLPVLMARGTPSRNYRQMLIAVDLSPESGSLLRTVRDLGLDKKLAATVCHAFEAPAQNLMARHSISEVDLDHQLFEHEMAAKQELSDFLEIEHWSEVARIVEYNETNVADLIEKTATAISADLLVLGSHGRSSFVQMILGSVTRSLLRTARQDVLVIPPPASVQEQEK